MKGNEKRGEEDGKATKEMRREEKKKATEKKGGDGKASFDNIAGGPAGRKLPPMLS